MAAPLTTSLISLEISQEFAAEAEFGTETFELIVDTRSSDTWVIEKGFTCINSKLSKNMTKSDCDFVPSYTKSSTFSAIPGETFNIGYADGESITGIMSTEEVTIAGIQFDQGIALATAAPLGRREKNTGYLGSCLPTSKGFLHLLNKVQIPHRTIFMVNISNLLLAQVPTIAARTKSMAQFSSACIPIGSSPTTTSPF
jgi:hypothetical protein